MLKLTGLAWTPLAMVRSNMVKKCHQEMLHANWKMCIYRTMVSKPYRIKKKKPPPFPYEDRKYNTLQHIWDYPTLSRFDENTKMIVVEGPVHSGKNETAKQIADAFEMKYLPAPTMDDHYINAYGYDLRNLDNAVPFPLQSFDEKQFNLNPTHFNVTNFQLIMYRLRFTKYLDALVHIFNTGQGVVTVRSPFSDYIWAESMYQCGHFTPEVKSYYYDVVRHSLSQLLRPHLIVYLDVPVNKTIENIKTRGTDYEKNSKALTPEFLQNMETVYKDQYLLSADVHSEILIADWTEEVDIDMVLGNIERIDFEIERHSLDPKLNDWQLDNQWYMDLMRQTYTNDKDRLIYMMDVDNFNIPELFANEEECKVYNAVMEKAPGNEYSKGFNYKRGDKVLWKDLTKRENTEI